MINTALIGSPVDHSLSPKLFSIYAEGQGLDYTHSKFKVSREDLETVIKALPAFGFAGVNITLPYKTDVMSYLDEISPEAVAIGAVNTIKVDNRKLIGFNTDAYGASKAIEKSAQRPLNSGDIAIVFGTGGAARAIIWSLITQSVAVTVAYRKPESKRTINLKKDFSGRINFVPYQEIKLETLSKCSLICNATSSGMYPESDFAPIDLSLLQQMDLSGVVVFDAIFNPLQTKLQTFAKEKNAILANGIDMMIYQGAVAFEYWTGRRVSDKTIKEAASMFINNT